MLTCKGSCKIQHEVKNVVRGEKNGFKRCTICSLYIKWEGVYCPCCGVKLKMSPTNNKARKAYRERQSVRNIDFE